MTYFTMHCLRISVPARKRDALSRSGGCGNEKNYLMHQI
uniref:Uncharacterized protein n=1 Tax=Parascaris equorum TaxID=6256 RepID=A0A914RJJ6_PAREQ